MNYANLRIYDKSRPVVDPVRPVSFPLSPSPSPPPPYDSMKSFVWFTTILLLCVELAHAAHITPAHVHRQHRRTPTKPNSRSLRRRATRTCNPPTTNTTDTNADNDNTSNPSSDQVDVTTNDGFPSLGFDMPSSVPSSLDGWWSDYESEIGFLGFSYAVSGCTSSPLLNFTTLDLGYDYF